MIRFIYIYFLIIGCFVVAPSYAQQNNLDSIVPLQDRAERINQLNQLSADYINTNRLDSAVIFATEALQLAQKIHYTKGEATALFHIGDVYTYRGKYKKAMSSFLKSLKIKHEVKDKSLSVKLYFKMANALARLKLYPQALKCYYKMMGAYEVGKQKNNYLYVDVNDKQTVDSTKESNVKSTVDSTYNQDSLAINFSNPVAMLPDDTSEVLVKNYINDSTETVETTVESPPLENVDITDCFKDGKKAVGYGLMIHVKQPIVGQRKAFSKISNVGHTFVTLIKFNADSSTLSRSFGFYPKKDNLFSATPLIPSTSSVFKDDAQHDWDEVVGKFISKRKFDRIIQLVKQYRSKRYNLNSNNCTDFGLDIANVAGIKIKDTAGSWPLGGGNNPANAGQSILEGKVNDEDKEDKEGLLIINSVKK